MIAQGDSSVTKANLLRSIPGIGPVSATMLIAEMLELGRMTVGEAAAMTGLAPVPHDSGTIRGRHAIAGGRWALRHVLFRAALVSACRNSVLKSVAKRLKEKGKPHKLVIIAIALSLVTIVNAILKTGLPWRTTPITLTQLLVARSESGALEQTARVLGCRDTILPDGENTVRSATPANDRDGVEDPAGRTEVARSGLLYPEPQVKEHCRCDLQLPIGSSLNLLVDSTGIMFLSDGEWLARKHGTHRRRQYHRVHLVKDTDSGDKVAVEFTPSDKCDSSVVPELLKQIPADHEFGTMTGDGGLRHPPLTLRDPQPRRHRLHPHPQ